MLISQGQARSHRVNLKLACSLAAIAGALNASAFYAVGFFSANMTGNVSALSDHLATGQFQTSIFFLMIVLVFIIGSVLSALTINAGRRRAIAGVYAYSILSEAGLMALLGCADIWLATPWRVSLLVLGLAFLMGWQNATVTQISQARVRTTHVSGMATDIGIEIGTAIDIWRGRQSDDGDNRARLALHAFTMAAFLCGGVIGVVIYQAVGGYLLLICAALLSLIAMTGLRKTSLMRPVTAVRRRFRWRPPAQR